MTAEATFSELEFDTAEATEEAREQAPQPEKDGQQRQQQRPVAVRPASSGEPLYLDIETIPDFSREHLFGLGGNEEITEEQVESLAKPETLLGGTVKDITAYLKSNAEVIVAAYNWCEETGESYLTFLERLEKQSQKPRSSVLDAIRSLADSVAKAEADRLKKMGLTPEYCRIVAIGVAVGNGEPASFVVDPDDASSEVRILAACWELIAHCKPIVGYNVAGFDLPAIFARSIINDVPASRLIDLSPYRNDVLDLMLKRFPREKAMPLKHLAALYDIEIPADDCDGSQVLGLWEAGEIDKIKEYVESDVVITRELHKAMCGYWCV